MLETLRIQNLALIENVTLDFSAGMNTLTGETGAGKSFILKALDFLTGEKMHGDLIRHGAEKASVEAIFHTQGEELIIRRELTRETGRARLYINDQLSTQNTIQALRPQLIAHTSQHQQQKLLQGNFQNQILLNFIKDKTLLNQKNELAQRLQKILLEKKNLQEKASTLLEKKELLQFQFAEIEKVDPKANEEEELYAQQEKSRAHKIITDSFQNALAVLYDSTPLHEILEQLRRELAQVANIDKNFAEHCEQVQEFSYYLPKLEQALRSSPVVESDEDIDTEYIESRLYELSNLQRKLGRSIDSILTLQEEITDNLSFLDSCSLDLQALFQEELELVEQLESILIDVHAQQETAGKELSKLLEAELQDLGFSEYVQVIFEFMPTIIYKPNAEDAHFMQKERETLPTLTDYKARLLWVPNPGQSPQPLDKIASGGELSRFLLALASLQAKEQENAFPTLIFDEVDSGIGGITLTRVAEKLQNLAKHRQMLLITHWPQLAGLADTHFCINKDTEKESTLTHCKKLNSEEIHAELARMAGGDEHAKTLAHALMQKKSQA